MAPPNTRLHLTGAYALKEVLICAPAVIPTRSIVASPAVVDIFRLENGKIVEHWDVVQEVPETSANNNAVSATTDYPASRTLGDFEKKGVAL